MGAPAMIFKAGKVILNIWEREVEGKGEKFMAQSISITKPYKKDDKWENGTSFNFTDVPHILLCLTEAFKWKYAKTSPTVGTGGTQGDF